MVNEPSTFQGEGPIAPCGRMNPQDISSLTTAVDVMKEMWVGGKKTSGV